MPTVLFLRSSIIFSVLLVGILWSQDLHAQKVNRTKFKRDNRAPRITPDVENLDIPVSSDLQLICSGNRKLEWKAPASRIGQVEIVDTVEQDNEKERLGGPSQPASIYRSELHIHSARVTDTGTYRCHYEDEVEVEGSFNLINVFVNDPRQLFVPTAPPGMPDILPTFITLHEHKPGLIACRPTYSRAEVSLIRFDGKVIGDATFYAAEGFTVPFPNVFFSGDFTCRYRVDDMKQEQRLHLSYVANSEAPTPVIDTSLAKHVTAGKDFRLKCNATVHDARLELVWDFPSPSTSARATYSTHTYDRENANYGYTLYVSTLTVRDVDQTLDDGIYRCTAVVVTNREKRSSAEVRIKPYSMGIESHIKMAPVPASGVVEAQIHQNAILSVSVDAHPPPVFTWKLNGVPVSPKTPRYTMGAERGFEQLRIQGAMGSDHGNFTLEAVAGETRSAVNITLLVNEPPTVSMDSSGGFYPVGRTIPFKCSVRAFPMPHVVWKFQPCHRDCPETVQQEGGILWKELPAENVSTTTDRTGRTTISRFHGGISNLGSGYLRCETETNNVDPNDKSRSAHATIRVLATDVENGFKAEMTPPNPVELQNITITCIVNQYEFSDVLWEVLSPGQNNFRPVLTSDTVLTYVSQSSIFSNTYTLKIIHANRLTTAGSYRCVAPRKSGGAAQRSQDFNLGNLYPATSLTFTDGNSGVERVKVEYEGKMELECRVKGSPPPQFEWTKDGAPVMANQVVQIEHGGSRLVNHKVTPETEGEYSCRAYHARSDVSKKWKVEVVGDSATRRRTIIIASVVTPLIVLMCIVVLIIWLKYRKERTRRKELEYLEKIINNDTANPALIDPNAPLSDQVALLNYDDRWELARENLKIHNKILGSGQFGKVMRGEAKDLMGHPGELMVVAVKMLKEKADIVQRKALLGEIKVMMHIGQHLNVVNLLGACTKTITKGELFMIMEYCQNGSLQKYLKNHVGERFYNQLDLATMKIKPLGDDQLDEINQIKRRLEKSDSKFDGKIVTTRDLICYSFQVSNGMDYLAKHKIIHRDLAARNILVAENDVVKICDFGLAREDYTYVKKSQAVIPVKWVAIESIYDNVFTTESDVWAFGVLMWEIFTLGSTPYPGHEANSTFVERVRNGLRMDHPYLAPKEIYDIMRHCWEASPYARPSFSALSAHLGNLLDQSIVQRYLDMNTPFEQFNEEVLVIDDPGYINDPIKRNSQLSTGNGVTYANSYRLLPGGEQAAPSKPRRYPHSTDGAGDTVDAMELQPMLAMRHSPKPSRPGNDVDSGDYLNQDFISPKRNATPAKPVVDDVDETAVSTRTVTPSDSSASSGRRYPNAGDARTNFLYGANPVRFPKTSEV